jgi:hypothetical protein
MAYNQLKYSWQSLTDIEDNEKVDLLAKKAANQPKHT